jgi:hypothetical protein
VPRAAGALTLPLALVNEWAGGAAALLVGGSHASGSDVWALVGGRRVCLSDLDVYAVVPNRPAQRAAEARARAARSGLRARLLAWGFAAPLEASFLVPVDLERLPARPGTLELARGALVLLGDRSWGDRIPRWRPADVSAEEIRLLHENRAFELLLAWPGLAPGDRLPRLLSRHAVLKCALDVPRVRALLAGEYPDGAEALVAGARAAAVAHGAGVAVPAATVPGADFDAVLQAALDWRRGQVDELDAAGALREWRAVVSAWTALWRELAGPGEDAIARAARRAPLRRRLRRALSWPTRSGSPPALGGRLRHALRGTPQHRVNASGAALLLAAAEAPWAGAVPPLPPSTGRALAALGVVGRRALGDWPAAAEAAGRAWDLWMLDGQRTEPA